MVSFHIVHVFHSNHKFFFDGYRRHDGFIFGCYLEISDTDSNLEHFLNSVGSDVSVEYSKLNFR